MQLWTFLRNKPHDDGDDFGIRCSAGTMSDEPASNRWASPAGCSGSACTYEAEWSVNKANGMVSFMISARQSADHWTGIAFAREPRMVDI